MFLSVSTYESVGESKSNCACFQLLSILKSNCNAFLYRILVGFSHPYTLVNHVQVYRTMERVVTAQLEHKFGCFGAYMDSF